MNLCPSDAAKKLALRIKNVFECETAPPSTEALVEPSPTSGYFNYNAASFIVPTHRNPYSPLLEQHTVNTRVFQGKQREDYSKNLSRLLKEAGITEADVPHQAGRDRAALKDLVAGRFDMNISPSPARVLKRG